MKYLIPLLKALAFIALLASFFASPMFGSIMARVWVYRLSVSLLLILTLVTFKTRNWFWYVEVGIYFLMTAMWIARAIELATS